MFVEPDFSHIKRNMKWRYLDSLNSLRYSPSELLYKGENRIPRVEQASAEVIATIFMGNGIAVPNNQFMDSVGFLRIASDIVKGASTFLSKDKNVIVPLRFAIYDYSHEAAGGAHLKDPYLLTAYLFDKDGKDGRNFFEMSAWNELASRRREVAKILADQALSFPSDFIVDKAEAQLADDLIRILNFFAMNANLIIDAAQVKNIREEMISSVARLSKEIIETDSYFAKVLDETNPEVFSNRLSTLLDVVTVFSNLLNAGTVDYRSSIREDLKDTNDSRFDGIQGSSLAAREGVLNTVNSIYNFSGYISTRAEQENQTEPMKLDRNWGPDEAAFALGQWARLNYEKTQLGVIATYDISSNQDSLVPSDVAVSSDSSSELWKSFFDYQQSEKWNVSLSTYINSLIDLENKKEEYENGKHPVKLDELRDQIKVYEENRNKHIDVINMFLLTSYDKRRYKINIENNKAILVCLSLDGNMISKTQIEDFGEYATLTKEEKSARYAGEPAKDATSKSSTTDYRE